MLLLLNDDNIIQGYALVEKRDVRITARLLTKLRGGYGNDEVIMTSQCLYLSFFCTVRGSGESLLTSVRKLCSAVDLPFVHMNSFKETKRFYERCGAHKLPQECQPGGQDMVGLVSYAISSLSSDKKLSIIPNKTTGLIYPFTQEVEDFEENRDVIEVNDLIRHTGCSLYSSLSPQSSSPPLTSSSTVTSLITRGFYCSCGHLNGFRASKCSLCGISIKYIKNVSRTTNVSTTKRIREDDEDEESTEETDMEEDTIKRSRKEIEAEMFAAIDNLKKYADIIDKCKKELSE